MSNCSRPSNPCGQHPGKIRAKNRHTRRRRARNRYEAAYPRLEEFLTSVGRRKFLSPLYEELVKTADGKERALSIYRRARLTYHPIAAATIDDIVKWGGE